MRMIIIRIYALAQTWCNVKLFFNLFSCIIETSQRENTMAMMEIMAFEIPLSFKICVDEHNRVVPFKWENDKWIELGRYHSLDGARKRIKAHITGVLEQ